MLNRIRGLGFFLVLLLLAPLPGRAQTAFHSTLTGVDLGAFPRIEAFLDARDEQGNFITGLQAGQVQILEDNQTIPLSDLQESHPGVQFVAAMMPGPSFAVRNSQGISRYDFLAQALMDWARSRQGTTVDDCSLLVQNGAEVTHTNNAMQWVTALQASTLDPRQITPNLDTFSRAIDLASDATPRPGMGRAVLLITPPLEGQLALSLDNLSARASAQGVRVFIWLVTPVGAPLNQAANQLIDLTQTTGGQFATVTGEDTIPDLEDYLEPLRSTYHLSYLSKITGSGTHQISASIQSSTNTFTTDPVSFEFNIQPPEIAFLSPVLTINRKPPENPASEMAPDQVPVQDYQPTRQSLQVLIDFPDGQKRPMQKTSLYVDGVVAAENLNPPFDRFSWDLSGYQADGTHLLKVEAQDSLGMTATSFEIAIQVNVVRPTPNAWTLLSRRLPLIISLVVLSVAAIFLFGLVIAGRLRPYPLPSRQSRRKAAPVPQPIPARIEQSQRRLSSWVNRLQWPQRRLAPKAQAFLIPANEAEQKSVPPIPLTADEITLGSDPHLATLVLEEPSVEGLHARLTSEGPGAFRLSDQGSVAGTWVNYALISREGVKLEHGDLIHIGRLSFRFTLRHPDRPRKPVIHPLHSAKDKANKESPVSDNRPGSHPELES